MSMVKSVLYNRESWAEGPLRDDCFIHVRKLLDLLKCVDDVLTEVVVIEQINSCSAVKCTKRIERKLDDRRVNIKTTTHMYRVCC